MPKIVGTALLLSFLLLLILQPLAVNIVNAEMVRHSRDVERLLTDRIVCTEIVSRWLEDIGLTNISKELKVLAKELRFKDLANLSSLLLFELYTNASMALTIGGIELRALKRLAGYRDDITLRDVIQLVDVVRRQLLQDTTPIPSCSSTLSKVITDITHGLHGHRCSYNSSDILTLAFLWLLFLSERTVNKSEAERGFEGTIINLLMDNISRENLHNTLRSLMAYRSLVLGISLYKVLNAIQCVAPNHSQYIDSIDIEKRDFISNVLEVVRFFQELRSINTSISGKDVLMAFSLMESVDEMLSDFSNVGALAKMGRELVKLYLRHGNTSSVSSLALSTLGSLKGLEHEIEKALTMLKMRRIGLPTIVKKSWYSIYNTSTGYTERSAGAHRSEAHSAMLSYPMYRYSYVDELGLDLNLVDVVADPQILNLLDEVNGIDLTNYDEINENREAKISLTNIVRKERELTPISTYMLILILMVAALSIALSMLKTVALHIQLPHMFRATTFATTVFRRRDPLITEFWRTITEIATRYGITILLSDTHREAVKKLMTILDESDGYGLSWISRLYELARFSRREVAQSDKERALRLLRYFSQKYRGKDGR